MLRILISALMLATALPVAAQERRLTGAQIREALTDQTLITPRDGAADIRQSFYPDRRTRYNDGHESWGLWEVRGDQYCSQWPPQAGWVCYDVAAWTSDGKDWVVFIGESGTRYPGYIAR